MSNVRRNGDGKPIVGLDIDGTLADYHGWFLKFASLYFGRGFPDPQEINPRLKLWTFMGLRKRDYEDCKLAYRQGGMKRSMPCLPGAGSMTHELRRMGCEVWICTTRPYMRLDNIDPDTQEWLRRNDIEYDALLYDPRGTDDKYREFARQAKGRVILGTAEDLGEQAEAAIKHLNVPVWLRNRPYNKVYWTDMGLAKYADLKEPFAVHRWDDASELLALARNSYENYIRYYGTLAAARRQK